MSNTNRKIHQFLNKNIPEVTVENVYIPANNGVTKATSEAWYKLHNGRFNSELYDQLMKIKNR